MILCLAEVVTAEERARLGPLLEGGRYVSGAASAGWHARTVKHNLQLAGASPGHSEAAELIRQALLRNEVFRMGVLPRAVRPPLLSRYEAGMGYGTHVDDALMGDPLAGASAPVRSDVAVTVFLAEPEAYDGGELVIESAAGEQAFRLPAGAAIAYPADTLHRVEPVSRGVRSVAVTWAQSLVRDPRRREVLFDLDTARRALFERDGKTREFDLLSKSHANLLRMWSDV